MHDPVEFTVKMVSHFVVALFQDAYSSPLLPPLNFSLRGMFQKFVIYYM